MKRVSVLFAVAVLGVGLTACQSGPGVRDADAVDDWMQEQSASDRPGSLAAMAGAPVIASERAGGDEEDGIAVDFASAVSVTGLEFSCFGEETMGVAVELTGGTGTRGAGADDLVCAESPHLLSPPLDGVVRVNAVGTSEQGVGAWSVVVLGDAR